MAQSLFTSQVPAILNGDDGTDYTLGTEFSRATDGQITHGRQYFGDVAPATATFVLYDVATETEITRATFVDKSPGWQTIELPAPVDYTAGTALVAALYTSTPYVATANFFTADLVNDDLTAPAATNGRLGNTDQYPSIISGNDACFFADVVFAAGTPLGLDADPGAAAPDGVPAAATLGWRVDADPGAPDPGGLPATALAGWRVDADPGIPAADGLPATGQLGHRSDALAAGADPAGLPATTVFGWAVHADPGPATPAGLPAALTGTSNAGGAVITRPNTGTIMRPFTGVIARP